MCIRDRRLHGRELKDELLLSRQVQVDHLTAMLILVDAGKHHGVGIELRDRTNERTRHFLLVWGTSTLGLFSGSTVMTGNVRAQQEANRMKRFAVSRISNALRVYMTNGKSLKPVLNAVSSYIKFKKSRS
jgi:hypothetical protein